MVVASIPCSVNRVSATSRTRSAVAPSGDPSSRIGGLDTELMVVKSLHLNTVCQWEMNMGRLDGKVAVITGGASGMGLATVERFAAEGAKVVLTDLPAGGTEYEALVDRVGEEKAKLHYKNREKDGPNDGYAIAQRLRPNVKFVPADVTVADELAEVVDTAVREFGGLDIMYNNAGVGGAEGSVVDCSEAVFDRIIEINLKAVWRGIKLAVPPMVERGGGSIISTSSDAGLMGFPGLGSYCAAKSGVIGLT